MRVPLVLKTNGEFLVLRVPLALRVGRVLPGQKVKEVPLALKVLKVTRFPLVRKVSEVFLVEPVQRVQKGPLVPWVRKGCRELVSLQS